MVKARWNPVHEVQARNEVRHGQQENWHGENSGNPEAQGHVFDLGIFLLRFPRDCNGLESHSADWAVAGLILADLRMHRTGVDCLCFFLKRGILVKRHPAFGTIRSACFINYYAHKPSPVGRSMGETARGVRCS